MRLGLGEQRKCVFVCQGILNEFEKELKSEAQKLKTAGFVGKAWRVADDMVDDKWETLKGRLEKAFPDDKDPLNDERKKIADVFYGASTGKFRPRFKYEVEEILEGKVVFVEKKEDSETEDMKESSDEEMESDIG